MSNSQNISEQEMIGLANAVIEDTTLPPKHFIVLITLDEDGKTPASTLKIVSPFATVAIDSGVMETFEMITPRTWSKDWGNKPLKSSKSARISTRKKTIN